jgi:hypothetical protein
VRKARIPESKLCEAIRQVMLGQADNLGGGVFKKRLGRNKYRSIIVAKGGRYWVFEYLFAKKDRDNIDDSELTKFRNLAKAYATLTEEQVDQLEQNNAWMEICNDDPT